MKKTSLLILLFCCSIAASAQTAASYTFSQLTSTYANLSAPTALYGTTWDDDVIGSVPIGFTFQYCGVDYTSVGVCANGWISLGPSTPSGSYTAISSGTNRIAAMSEDLYFISTFSPNNRVSYQTTGTAPNRTFTIQWQNVCSYSNAASGPMNFQIKLYETYNVVDIVYGSCSATLTTGYSAQVGLVGSATSDFNNRATSSNWSSTSAGTANTATCIHSSSIMPPSGLTFRWTPVVPTCTGSPVSGTVSVGVGGTYPTLAAAIAAINLCGISGNVIVNVPTGWTETAPFGGYSLGSATLNASTSSSATLTFRKNGSGANPLITANVGSTTTLDGIFKISGTDYVTIDGIDLQEASSNTTATTMMEWGYALVKRNSTSPIDGCQNVTIKNCIVTLNKNNPASACIYSGNHVAGALTALTLSATTDATNNCTFSGNTLTNANRCISITGYTTAPSSYSLYDQNNTIGGATSGLGNSLTQFGGTSTAGYGVYLAGQNNASIRFNSIASATTPGTGAVYAVFHGIGLNSSFDVSDNTIQMTASTGAIYGIANGTGSASSGASGTGDLTIARNTFQNYTFTSANSTASYLCLYNYGGSAGSWGMNSVIIKDNIVKEFSLNATGTHYMFYNYYCTTNDVRFNNNKIRNIRRTSASGSTYCYYNYYGSASGGVDSVVGNKISEVSSPSTLYCIYDYLGTTVRDKVIMNDTLVNDSTISGTFYGLYNFYGNNVTVANNRITNLNAGGTGALYLLYNGSADSLSCYGNFIGNNNYYSGYGIYGNAGSLVDVHDNTIENGSQLAGTGYYYYSGGGAVCNWYNNTLKNITSTGAIYSIYQSGGTNVSFYNNHISNISSTTTGVVYGAYASSGTYLNFYNNTFDSLKNMATTSGAVYGIYQAGGTSVTCYRNRLSHLVSNGSSGTVYGIYLGGGTTNVYNNIVGDLQSPNSNSTTGTNLVGIYVGSGTLHSVAYNTVVLNSTSTGANFASSALYHTYSTNLILRNNILINNSVQNGSGVVAAYRRSSSATAAYNGTSDRNILYAGTPGTYRVLMYNGSTGYQSIWDYRAALSPADANSFTENTTFQSLTGIGTDFLRPSLTSGTYVEGGALNITGITDDHNGSTRAGNSGYSGSGSMPDIGAIEDDYTPPAPCSGTPDAGTASVSPASGGSSTSFTLSAAYYTLAGATAFQWQSSSDSTTWSNISGATTAAYTFTGITANTYYRLIVTCTPSGISSISSPVMATYNPYCTPSFTTACSVYNMNTSIASLVGYSGAITDPSTTCTSNYADNSASMSVSLVSGVSYSTTLNVSTSYFGSFSSQVWIDFNDDGTFQSTETIGGITTFTSAAQSTTLNIPSGLPAGTHRMRIVGSYSTPKYPTMNPCPVTGTSTYGQARDYTVNILCAPVTPITGSSLVCAGATVSLSNATSGGTWAASDSSLVTIATSGIATGISAGTATISYILSTGCYASTTITVSPLPSVTTGSATTICAGSTTTLSASGADTYTWSPGTGLSCTACPAPIASPSGTTEYTVTGTSTAGCSATAATIVSVNPLPASISGPTSVCLGANITLTNITTGGTWSSGTTGVAVIGSLSGIVTPVSAGSATITYMLATGCYITREVVVSPPPTITTSGTVSMCVGSSAALSASGAASYTWTPGASLSCTNCASPVANPSTTTVYTVTGIGTSGCTNTATSSVVVNPLPAAITGTTTACSGATTTLSCSPGGGAWSTSGTVASVNTAGVVSGLAGGTATIVYTLGTGCSTSTVVTINETPSGVAGSLTTCISGTTTLTSSPSGGSWTSAFPSKATINSTTGLVTGISSGTTNVTYTTGAGCYTVATVTVAGAIASITGPATLCEGSTGTLASATTGGSWSSSNTSAVTINATSGAVSGVGVGTSTIMYTVGSCFISTVVTVNTGLAAISGNAVICEGQSSALSNSVSGGTWSSASGSIATVGATSGVVTAVSTGIANITYTAGAGCFTVKEVTVNGAVPAITGTTSLCTGGLSTLANSTTGGTWSSSNTAKATVSASTGEVSGVSAGTATITYMIGAACYTTTGVVVNSAPAGLAGSPAVCVGANTALTSSPGGGTWTSSNTTLATVSTTGTVTGVGAGIATITYTLSTGCASKVDVTVSALPHDITGSFNICTGTTEALTSTTTGGSWSSSNTYVAPVNAATGVVTGNNVGTSRITYTVPGGCYVIQAVTVAATPAPITGNLSVCIGSTTSLGSATTGGAWSTDDAAIATVNATSGLVTAVAAGTVTINYSNGTCARMAVVTVNAGIAAITGSTTLCVGSGTSLSHGSSGGTWTTSNGSIAAVNASTGVVTGISAGTANITYTLSPGCYSFTEVTVNTSLSAILGTLSVCPGATTALSHAVSGGSWSSSNTSRATVDATTGVVTGISAGTTTIIYGSSGCAATATLTVYSSPSAIGGTASVCEGATAGLSCTPGGGTWSTADAAIATVSTSGVFTGVAAGVVNISYTSGAGCPSVREVTISATPTTITGAGTVCVGGTTTLASTPAGGYWTSAFATKASVNATTGVVTGVSVGTTRVTYTTGTGCYAYTVVTIESTPATISGVLTLCVGSTTNLSSATYSGTWSSSDAAIATVGAATGIVSGIASGTATISYSNGTCERTVVVTVNAGITPITGDLVVCVGSGSVLANATSGGTWSSATTSVATINASTGIVTGVSAGTANIVYTVSGGCSISATITVNATLAAISGSLSVCPGATTALTHATAGGTWSSSNTTKATIDATTGIATGVAAGTTTITYMLSAGCFRTATLGVSSSPAALAGTATICQGFTTSLTCSTGGGTWSTSDAAVATVVSGVVTGVATGTATISYTVGSGCASTKEVTVTAAPSSITGSLGVCVGTSSSLSATPAGGTWNVAFTSKATVGAATGVVTGVSVGTTRITYSLSAGCYIIDVVSINASPSSISGPNSVCVGNSITQSSATFSGVWSTSDAAIATVGAATGVVTGVGGGTVTVTYTKAGCFVTKTVTVNAGGGTITGDALVCVGQTNNSLTVGLTGGTWSSSASSIASVHATNGLITGVSAGNANITYTFSPGCFITRVATVNAPVSSITGPTSVIIGNTVTLANATAGGTWISSNTYKATIDAGTGDATGVAAGTTTITYRVSAGCYNTRNLTVTYSRPDGPGTATTGATFSVFPNPTTGTLTVESAVSGVFTVYTLDSRVVEQYIIDDSVTAVKLPYNLAPGVYMCRFAGADGSAQAVRIILQQ